MVLVLFFLIIIILIFLTSLASIQIDIRNFKLYKEEKIPRQTNKDYEVIVYGYIFKKIKIFKYKINDKKMRKKYFENIKKKIDLSILKSFFSNNFDISNVKFVEIESLNLKLNLGTENVIVTSGIVTLSNILISFFLAKLITSYNKEKYKYEVKAIFENKNKIDLFLESRIRIKLFSILKAVKSYNDARKMFYKKEKSLQT